MSEVHRIKQYESNLKPGHELCVQIRGDDGRPVLVHPLRVWPDKGDGYVAFDYIPLGRTENVTLCDKVPITLGQQAGNGKVEYLRSST